MPRKHLDLLNLSDEEKSIFHRFLIKNKTIPFFKPERPYHFSSELELTFSHYVLLIGSNTVVDNEYLLLDKELVATSQKENKDNTTNIYAVGGQFGLNTDTELSLKVVNLETKYLLKLQSADRDWQKKSIKREFLITRDLPHLGTSFPLINFSLSMHRKKHYSAFLQKLQSGVELFQILKNDIEKKRMLSIKERFLLSIALFRSYKQQVFDNNLVHRDVKPENIIVSMGDTIQVNFIDYEHAKHRDEDDKGISNVGTRAYISPEIYKRLGSTVDSDIYALGIIMMLIWRAKPEDVFDREINPKLLFENFATGELHNSIRETLHNLMHRMIEIEPTDRPGLFEIKNTLNDTYEAYQNNKPFVRGSSHTYIRFPQTENLPSSFFSRRARICSSSETPLNLKTLIELAISAYIEIKNQRGFKANPAYTEFLKHNPQATIEDLIITVAKNSKYINTDSFIIQLLKVANENNMLDDFYKALGKKFNLRQLLLNENRSICARLFGYGNEGRIERLNLLKAIQQAAENLLIIQNLNSR